MRKTLAPFALVFAVALAQPAASLTIDNFESGNFNIVDDSTTATPTLGEQSGLLTTDVVGGVRLVSVLGSAGGLGVATATAALVTAPVVDDGALMTMAAVPDGTGQFQYIYDGSANGINNGTGGALNLNLSSFSTLDVTLNANSVVGDVQVTLYSSALIRDQTLPIANGVLSFPLSGFTLNLADVQAIRVWLVGINTAEAPIITNIAANAVPEPATGLLVALGLVGVAIRRRSAAQ